jgi:hypothetical protein
MRLVPLAAVFVFVASVAAAHHLAAPKVDLVSVSLKEVRIAVDYSVDPAKGGELRSLYDGTRDGLLAAEERTAAEQWLRVAATHFLSVQVDGKTVALSELAAEFRGLDGRGVPGALVVLSGPLALGKGAHRLELTDRHKDAAIAVPVRVTFARGIESEVPDAPLLVGAQTPTLAIDFHAQ